MNFEYTVKVDGVLREYTFLRARPLAEHEVIDLGDGLRVVVEAVEVDAAPGQPGRVRANRHVNIVHQG